MHFIFVGSVTERTQQILRCVCATYLILCTQILDAPILNFIKMSLICLFVTDVKYGSKEIEFLNILYILDLVLLLTCSCQFWLWQSISLSIKHLDKSLRILYLLILPHKHKPKFYTKPGAPVMPSRIGHCYVLIAEYCRPFVEALRCALW